MMMRMLEAGGLPVITDGLRRADDDNPGGYYEFEAVKRLSEDDSWVADAYGKAVKVIYLLLYSLPPDHNYKVIFMRRKLEEVIASQAVMLRHRHEKGSSLTSGRLMESFRCQTAKLEEWMNKRHNLSVLYINYDQVLFNPEKAADVVDQFLGVGLDTQAMIRVVDPSLYRQRL
jgi:hypothetical protein